jgi:ribosomal protein S18 acetylase RimI-like enzyme
MQDLLIEPARRSELTWALDLAFQHHKGEERRTRVRNALRLIRRGEVNPSGILVARSGTKLIATIICLPMPGASALVWPPQGVAGSESGSLEDRLVEYGRNWLESRGVKLAQSLLSPNEKQLALPLLRNGFSHITNLRYLRHELQLPPEWQNDIGRLNFQTYAKCYKALFHETLLASYAGTLDCPEVNGVREIDEIITGHQAQGFFDPAHWWLAFDSGQAAGVLLMTESTQWKSWDLSYVGVVPEARHRGVGRELTQKALIEARNARAEQLTLALDTRNRPAAQLYQSLGFEPFDEREVYLAIWKGSLLRKEPGND